MTVAHPPSRPRPSDGLWKRHQHARFGNLRPSSEVADEPYDFAELHHEDAGLAARHDRHARKSGRFDADERNRYQFRTRPDLTIYPLANTCWGAT